MNMRQRIWLATFSSAALLGLVLTPATAASASTGGSGWQQPYDCTGGTIPPGVYASMVITGDCYMSDGNITVGGNVNIAPGALLDAVKSGDPTGAPVVPATVHIGGSVYVGNGAALLFGCSPNITCTSPPGITYDHIGGNLIGFGAQGVVLHSASVAGNISLFGGGGGTAGATCKSQKPGKPINTALEPWSEDSNLYFTPVYTDIEDVTVGGNLSIVGVTSCWLGNLRDQVRGSAAFIANTMGDPDAMEVDNNLISGGLFCFKNTPQAQFGDGGSAPNIVSGYAAGECGFGVTDPSPAPEAGEGTGIPEHISVSASSLQTYTDTYTFSQVAAIPPVTTDAGDQLLGELKNFTIAGSGLTGTGTVNPKKAPGKSGEADLITVYPPSGWQTFTAFDTCNPCSLSGQTGKISFRLYGTTSPSGFTNGSFLISSGGGLTPGSLRTIAGFGTFTSSGQPAGTFQITEHVAVT